MRRFPLFTAVLGVALPLSGCLADLGECDAAAARELVFRDSGDNVDADNGLPMFAGQGLVMGSCGNGEFCHSANARGEARYGATFGLDFDLGLVCTDGPCQAGDPAIERLRSSQEAIMQHARMILRAARNGTMPPGDVGEDVLARAPSFRRLDYLDTGLVDFDLRSHTVRCDALPPGTCAVGETEKTFPNPRLPSVGSEAGNEILRNWLACGAPVVESTLDPLNGAVTGLQCMPNEGGHAGECFVRIAAPIDVPQPTWSSIYSLALFPACGAKCHSPSDPAHFRDSALDLSSSQVAYAALVNRPARGSSECVLQNWTLVVPGDPDASLLVSKLAHAPDLCGDPMGSFADPVVEAVRTWIANGAQND